MAEIIAEVTKPIIGADFLQHFGLLVDLKKRCLLDPVTNITARGRASLCDIPVFKIILGDSEYIELLKKCNEITQLSNTDNRTAKHDTVQGWH